MRRVLIDVFVEETHANSAILNCFNIYSMKLKSCHAMAEFAYEKVNCSNIK